LTKASRFGRVHYAVFEVMRGQYLLEHGWNDTLCTSSPCAVQFVHVITAGVVFGNLEGLTLVSHTATPVF